MRRPKRRLLFALSLFVAAGMAACSPAYVLRAGWEQAGVLLQRQRIHELLKGENIEAPLRSKFLLVLDAREFAQSAGLKPKGSYLKYVDLGREVYIWVLNAAPKTSLRPVTWWFPIVGRVPYKGFFNKENALYELDKLKEAGNDVYLRPSSAMSTLGWFDDPLLSTVVRYDEVALVDTVIHELLHNTVWVPGKVEFNESLANFVGARGAEKFFQSRGGEKKAAAAADRWHDEILYGAFLRRLSTRLERLYTGEGREDMLAARERIFEEARAEWHEEAKKLRAGTYASAAEQLNNAVIVANRIYLKDLEVFEEAYESCGQSLAAFLELVQRSVKRKGADPYQDLRDEARDCQRQG